MLANRRAQALDLVDQFVSSQGVQIFIHVATLCNSLSTSTRRFFTLAFALSWGIGGIALLIGLWKPELRPLSTSSPLYYLAAYSISLTGLVFTARYDGIDGLRDLGRRLLPWRSSPRWYLFVVIGYATITAISLWGVTQVALSVVAVLRDPGPLGEEFGWRGFALPRLLQRYPPLTASIRLGLIHALWHLPLFFIPGMPQTQVSFPLFTLGVVAIAIFDTAVYLRSGANLLLAILIHLLANFGGGLAAAAGTLSLFLALEAVAAALVVAAGGVSRPSQAAAMRRT